VFDSTRSDATALNVHVRIAGLQGVEVISEKQGTLDFADRQGSNFTELFGLIGGFIVVAGVLLLVNIFVMLAEERTHELGLLRALGLKRNHLVRTFGLEGNLYALAAATAGALAGIGVARVIVSAAERIFSEGDRGATLRFAVTPASVLTGFAIGLVISLVTVWLTSIRIGRLNVIRAIRGAPEPRRRWHPWWGIVIGGIGLLAGSQMFVSGVQDHEAVLALAGSAIALWSAVPLLEPFASPRVAITVPCAVLLVWPESPPGLGSIPPPPPHRPGRSGQQHPPTPPRPPASPSAGREPHPE
jgi:putative ABC transport system permease protein